jgi:DNA polymerase-4
VVAAASYEVRKFGVRSAMPIREALRRCPHAICVKPRMSVYREVSHQVFAVFHEYTPIVEGLSLDEAFLDVTASLALKGDALTIARGIKDRIRATTQLAASVGVAPNKLVAKVASDLRKPDGLVVVAAGTEADFLAPLPVSRLWGVGRVTAEGLEAMGLQTIGQLAAVPGEFLEARFGPGARGLQDLAHGRDDRAVEPFAPPKSMGAEETFDRDHRDVERLHATLREQAERVARELRADGYAGRCVTLKLRFADFSTLTRRHTDDPTQDGLAIYRRARALLGRIPLRQPVRLIGLSVSSLGPAAAGQLSLLEPDAQRRERLARAMDRVTARFGEESLRPASVVRRPGRTRPSDPPARGGPLPSA